jgi:aspartyl-tRNA(Asn)/glutamyl-tRNA(Gln) amidotransferase subunit A
MNELHSLTLTDLSAALAAGKVTSVEATEAILARLAAKKDLGAYLYCDAEGALAQAAASDARRQAGKALGPLDGIAMGLKDIFMVNGQPTTCGSKILEHFVAPYDATVVQRLKDAGVVLLGKHSMDEFAMGSSNEHSAYGPVKNAWDPTCVPGGSSGGSATSVASGTTFVSLGTDTGGSIRQPASYTGTVGLKPTYGRVSRYGVIAYASSLDQVGPMTKDVTDCAKLLQVISGNDPRDATSAPVAVPNYSAELEAGVQGLRLGVPREYFTDGIDTEVRKLLEAALKAYEKLGAKLVEVSLPHTDVGIATYYILAPAEASSNLNRYDGVRYGSRRRGDADLLEMYLATRSEGFGDEVKRRILLGTYVLSSGYYDAYYTRAQRARTLVRRDFAAAFEKVDALVTPTAPTAAFKLGQKLADPMSMYMADTCTIAANLAGVPGISLPCGFTEAGLPVGQQLLAAPFAEALLLRLARAYERAHDWHTRRAP